MLYFIDSRNTGSERRAMRVVQTGPLEVLLLNADPAPQPTAAELHMTSLLRATPAQMDEWRAR